MTPVKIHREELAIVKEAALRLERRNNAHFVIDTRVEVTDDECHDTTEKVDFGDAPKAPAVFD